MDTKMATPIKVNLQAMSFGLALIVQTILLVGYITGIASDVETAVRDIDRNMTRIDTLEKSVHAQEVLLARIAGDMAAIRESVQRIDERGREK